MAKIYAIELPVLEIRRNLQNKLSAVRVNEDYQELNEEIVFEVGENYKQVTNNDELVERPELFIITLVPLSKWV